METQTRFLNVLGRRLSQKKLNEEFLTIFNKTNFIASNMTTSLKAPWYFQGKKVHWVSILGCPEFNPSISLVSLHDSVRVTGVSDLGTLPEIGQLVQNIEKELMH